MNWMFASRVQPPAPPKVPVFQDSKELTDIEAELRKARIDNDIATFRVLKSSAQALSSEAANRAMLQGLMRSMNRAKKEWDGNDDPS